MKVKTFFLLIVFFGFSLFLFSMEPEDLISQGDELYIKMKDMVMAKEATAKYLEALKKEENKYEAYWKMARILCYIGVYAESKKEKKKNFAQGIYYGRKAVNREPEKPDGYYWLGVNYGFYGEAKGVLKSLALVKPIKRAMNKVIELDHEYDDGGPDRVLGRVYFKVPRIFGGSKDKSLEHLLMSKEIGPYDPLTRVYLAETYLAKKQVEKAREELEYVLNMEADSRWVTGIDGCKEVARKLLQKKQFRKKK